MSDASSTLPERPCRNGHTSGRYTSSRHCRQCRAEQGVRWRARQAPGYQRRLRGMPEPTRPCPETCECCGRLPNGHRGTMHLDHCHDTGAFRGWLCHSCNSGIGSLGDDVEGLTRAIDYLTRANL